MAGERGQCLVSVVSHFVPPLYSLLMPVETETIVSHGTICKHSVQRWCDIPGWVFAVDRWQRPKDRKVRISSKKFAMITCTRQRWTITHATCTEMLLQILRFCAIQVFKAATGSSGVTELSIIPGSLAAIGAVTPSHALSYRSKWLPKSLTPGNSTSGGTTKLT